MEQQGETNKKCGHYSRPIAYTQRKYQSASDKCLPCAHCHLEENGCPRLNTVLEFWAWDFIADRDTTLDIRYHRMEAYGLRAFCIRRISCQ